MAKDLAERPLELTIALAGGGSGGHIYPGLAIAERISQLAPHTRSIFLCSNRAIDRRILEAAGAERFPVDSAPFSWRPGAALAFGRGYWRSCKTIQSLLHREQVSHVVAMGGFVAAPAVHAARRLGISVTLVNLDAPPGKANRWMARRCDRVLTAIPLPTHPGFAERIVGMPVRRGAIATADAATCRQALGLDPDRNTLLVVGGSQGAGTINELLVAVVRSRRDWLHGWQICHLCGADAEVDLRELYAAHDIAAVVAPFSDRMDLAWGAANLAVSRAGASSVAEAASERRPDALSALSVPPRPAPALQRQTARRLGRRRAGCRPDRSRREPPLRRACPGGDHGG